MCGPVTYNITLMPSHGMMMKVNNTAYKINGLNNNTNYTITVYASNNNEKGEQTMITAKLKSLPPAGNVLKCNTQLHICMYLQTYICMTVT